MTESAPLRIAHFIDTQNKGGAEVTLMDLCLFQKEAGHEVMVFHHNNPYLAEECKRHDIAQYDIPAHRLYKSTYTLPLYAITLAKKLKKLKIDILHSHLFGPITGNALAARLAGRRHIGTLHDIYMIEEKPARARLLQLASILRTKLVCVSRNMTEFYDRHLQFSSTEIHTIYNAARKPEPPSAETSLALKTKYHIAEQDMIISAVGRLVPLKRVDKIIKALQEINLPHVKLVIIGDGPESKSLRTLTTALKLEEQVIFTGEITNVSDLLYLSHVFTQFSSTEGLSISIIEALACKLPCVVSDVGGNSELVADGQTGYVVASDRDDLLATRLHELLDNEALRNKFGNEAHLRFKEYFIFEQFQDSYLKLYTANKPN